MKKILLIRHGLIDYETQQLNNLGRDFASKLPSLLPVQSLGCVCSDESCRCRATVAPLSERFSVDVDTFSKKDFKSCCVLKHSLKNDTSVICYRIEAINPILAKLGLDQFTEDNRDSSYEFIWDLSVDDCGAVCSKKKIRTGFSKAD